MRHVCFRLMPMRCAIAAIFLPSARRARAVCFRHAMIFAAPMLPRAMRCHVLFTLCRHITRYVHDAAL